MENFTLQALTSELSNLLQGRRLGKVYQLGATDLALDFRLTDGRWLMISTDPQRLALYLTSRAVRQLEREARSDTAFIALIKKHLGSARLAALDKLGYDRVARFAFDAEDEEGREVARELIVELTGRGANVWLLDQGHVVTTLREREETPETYHEPEPPADKLDPFLCSREKLDELIASYDGKIEEAAKRGLIGFGPLYARELAARAANDGAYAALHQLLDDSSAQPQPSLYSSTPPDELRREIGRADFALTLAPIEFVHLRGQIVTRFSTINEAADVYFTLLDERRDFLALRQHLESALAARLKKQRALAANLQRERSGFAEAATHQRYGELLLANLHQAVKTERGFSVTDFYDAAQSLIEIPAANKPTAQETAEHYFRLARKARHGLKTINERLPQIEREVAQLENQLTQLTALTQRDQLNSLAAQVNLPAKRHPAKPTQAASKKAKEERLSGVRRYRSSDGYEILVGRADRDNDALTFRIAKSFDLWFHAADYPGSHVVLRNPQRKPVPPRAITEAAQLAAKFSQARSDARVAVNYCERKFVMKLKGFAPGQVRISSFKTVLVEPREAGERLL
jgi:predicted ribosome quality control (RQC) complex YloA/Tae2 family protein